MKKLCVVCLLAGFLSVSVSAQIVKVGMTEAELVELKGSPQSKAGMGKKSIYRWPDMQVTLVDGKVQSFQHRDAAAEAQRAKQQERAQVKQKADAKREAREKVLDEREDMAHARREANAANKATEERLRRAAQIQQRIRSIERQLDEDAKRSSFGNGPKPMSSEARALLNFQLDNLRHELANLR